MDDGLDLSHDLNAIEPITGETWRSLYEQAYDARAMSLAGPLTPVQRLHAVRRMQALAAKLGDNMQQQPVLYALRNKQSGDLRAIGGYVRTWTTLAAVRGWCSRRAGVLRLEDWEIVECDLYPRTVHPYKKEHTNHG